jgi:hypothetical protein
MAGMLSDLGPMQEHWRNMNNIRSPTTNLSPENSEVELISSHRGLPVV